MFRPLFGLFALSHLVLSCQGHALHQTHHASSPAIPEPVPRDANDVLCSSCASFVSRLQISALSITGQDLSSGLTHTNVETSSQTMVVC